MLNTLSSDWLDSAIESLIPPSHCTIVDRLEWHSRNQPDRIAIAELRDLCRPGDTATFAQLDARARAVAARLETLSARGDRVLLVMGNHLDYVVGFFACAYANRVAVNLLVPRGEKHLKRLAHVAGDCDAKVLLTAGREANNLLPRVASDPVLAELKTVLVDQVPPEEAAGWHGHSRSSGEPCLLQYTSGSTSAPRGVVVTHDNLVFNCGQIERGFGFTAKDRGLSWLPLYHDMGLILGVLTPLFVGFPVLLTDPLSFVKRPDRWLRAISDYRITYSGGPNFTYDLGAGSAPDFDGAELDLSTWRVALNGAEPIRSSSLERFDAAFADRGWSPASMQPAYGLAEATLVVSSKAPNTAPAIANVDVKALTRTFARTPQDGSKARLLVSSGRIFDGTTVQIVDPETGQSLGPDRVGEIWLSGRSVAGGYWNKDALTNDIFRARIPGDPANYLRTGDLAFRRDEDLFVVGRLKDVLIVHGVNHYPQDLEETVERAEPAVRPHFVAVFSEERDEHEAIVVVAEIRREAEVGLDAKVVAHRIAHAISREHEIAVDSVLLAKYGEVPKTTSGKIQRSLCRELVQKNLLAVHESLDLRQKDDRAQTLAPEAV